MPSPLQFRNLSNLVRERITSNFGHFASMRIAIETSGQFIFKYINTRHKIRDVCILHTSLTLSLSLSFTHVIFRIFSLFTSVFLFSIDPPNAIFFER